MKVYYPIFILFMLFCACQTNTEKIENVDIGIVDKTEMNLEIKTLYNDSIGWGYQIYVNGNIYINQPHVPAVQGLRGFETEEQAMKTAEYVSRKIENGVMPPTINIEEIDSLLPD